MLTLLLVRHATHDRVGKVLCGRMPGVSLSAEGLAQAEALAGRVGREPVGAVIAGPLERARETAAPLAARCACPLMIDPAIDEIDCGAWTGARFADLDADPRWAVWNRARAASTTPGGESMAAVQARAMGLVRRLGAQEGRVALVSHADVIKAVVMAVLGLSLDRHDSFTVDPASVTMLHVWGETTRLVRLNEGATP